MRASDFVESYFEAWNHQDPVAVADHLTDDGVYLSVPDNERRKHDELILTLEEFFASHHHSYELIGEILEGRNTIAFQYRMCPHVKGRKCAEDEFIRGSEFITMDGDSAVRICDYYEVSGQPSPGELVNATRRRRAENKYAKSGLCEQQLESYKRQLQRAMIDEQLYLKSDMTLPRLAETIGCSVNHLSQVINAGFGVSFFDYLNRFRVEHAKALLSEGRPQDNAVLNVAFTVGFNSNSAFYAAFRKYVGRTPAQYRRQQQQT
ncbi:MAG: helix-turn-helix domain-containing protein [Pseudomonadota bacterium]